ncbi:MAG: hypothetical protein A2571_03005 [Candidatus Vogelbacteria bacterium RIFOXYD1_FULL_44_32]|uniref:General secretion pathway GspH domain-containing protein n=1 Tax=Candidatus Vogelbacteria bacterium RIFOXYD1_FULL_44_32 TaxID=1802438 RepID=A0A1G2QCA8_9BACT|nr:MAG: hypothetical protein A2571_03005 [Candidatus Vogelbacteria bacterium RIFOXYD1_FULL_44_32]
MLEMMVVVAIVLAMTSIVIMYIPQFRDRSALDLVAQDIAITIRSAQVYASGGKIPAGATETKPSYGVHFSTETTGSKNREFYLYTNNVGNVGFAGLAPGDPGVFDYKLHAITVARICVDGGQCDEIETLDVIYTRPQLGAKIYIGGNYGQGENKNSAEIYIKADKTGKEKMIIVRSNGQISVENVVETP